MVSIAASFSAACPTLLIALPAVVSSPPAFRRPFPVIRAASALPLPRRALLFCGSAAAATLPWSLSAGAVVSRRVRLKDVKNPKLQEALRAAVAGDLEAAEKIFSELLVEDPESASVWSNRGSVRISLRRFDEALADLTKAIELAPEAPVPFLNRAIALEMWNHGITERLSEIAESLSVSCDPKATMQALGRYEDAISDCKSAIEKDPEEYAAWFNLGNVDARVNNFDDALAAYQKASLLAPGIAGYRLKEALILFQLSRTQEARKLLEGLIRKYPNYAEAHAALAAVLWNEGERSKAEEQFTEATRREPLYNDLRWVNAELLWPPNLVKAMENFLSII